MKPIVSSAASCSSVDSVVADVSGNGFLMKMSSR